MKTHKSVWSHYIRQRENAIMQLREIEENERWLRSIGKDDLADATAAYLSEASELVEIMDALFPELVASKEAESKDRRVIH
jgi:hypothetical protein